MGEIRTGDVFEASYFRVCGLELVAIEIKEDLPKTVQCAFVLSGEEELIDSLSTAYATGRAVVNVTQFKRFYSDSFHTLKQTQRKAGKGGAK